MDVNNPKELPIPEDMLIEAHETDGIVATGSLSPKPKRAFLHWSRGMFILVIGACIGILLSGSVIMLASKHAKPSLSFTKPQGKYIDPTANWKTYTYFDKSFSIKYPSSLSYEVDDGTHAQVPFLKNVPVITFTNNKIKYDVGNNFISNNIYMIRIYNKNTISPEDALASYSFKIANTKSIKIGQNEGQITTSLDELKKKEGLAAEVTIQDKIYYFSYAHIGQENGEEIFFNILSTFKLTNHPNINIAPSSIQQKAVIPTTEPTVTPTKTPSSGSSSSIPSQNTNSGTSSQQSQSKPVMQISYPTDGQTITMNSSQTFCVVDSPINNTQRLQKKENTGGGWTSYRDSYTTCYNPAEGDNTLQLQYKNDTGQESDVYTVHFTFHHE